jgi:hypothetical protein
VYRINIGSLLTRKRGRPKVRFVSKGRFDKLSHRFGKDSYLVSQPRKNINVAL